MGQAEINIRMPFSWQQMEKALPMKPKTLLTVAAATAVVASGTAVYIGFKTELISKARKTVVSSLRTMQYFSAASGASSEVLLVTEGLHAVRRYHILTQVCGALR